MLPAEHARATFLVIVLATSAVACGDHAPIDADVSDSDAADGAIDAPGDADVDESGDRNEHDVPDSADADVDVEAWSIAPGVLALGPMSTYVSELVADAGGLNAFENARPGGEFVEVGTRGALGFGNGHVFAFTGYDEVVSTLHSMTGPTYERRGGFFGDYTVRIEVDGVALAPGDQRSGRLLDAPIVFTAADHDGILLETIDFAPVEPAVANRCVARLIFVTNTTSADMSAAVVVRSARSAPAEGQTLVESRENRYLRTGFVGTEVAATTSRLSAAVSVAPGETTSLVLAHCTALDAAPTLPDFGAPTALLVANAAALRMSAPPAEVEVPDTNTAAFIRGMEHTLRVQRSAEGAWCPMSQYTRMWVRDTIGPFLAMLALGDVDAAAEMLDYLHRGAALNGDFRNSYDADIVAPGEVAEPDWDALPPLEGRTAAETPSYLVWMYAEHFAASGDDSRIRARWPMIRRALFSQAISEDGLIPFSGDETFRAAMNAAFGLPLESPHDTESWSLNSSLLWIGAARRFVAMAEHLGETADAEQAEALLATIEAAVRERYLLEDGCLAALIERETDTVWPAPYEDAALQTVWAGAFSPDDEFAQTAFACLLERVEREPGMPVSAPDPRYHDLPMLGGANGVYTGMLPGYALYAYTAHGHPSAIEAATWMGTAADPTGNFQEYIIAGDHVGLQLIYDAIGDVGDYTAKFRPWEGGINLHALLNWLYGLERTGDGIAVRPHLPTGWPSTAIRRWPAHGVRWDVEVGAGVEGALVVRLSHDGVESATARVRLDGVGTGGAVLVDGLPVSSAAVVERTHWGAASHELEVDVGAEAVVEVSAVVGMAQ